MTSFAVIEAPFGVILVQNSGQFFSIIMSDKIENIHINQTDNTDNQNKDNPTFKKLCAEIQAYFTDKKSAFTAIDVKQAQTGTAFQQRVWQAITEIPFGKTSTYSEIANKIGAGPRAVANACGANQLPILVPCHRVVAKNGLGGFMQGADGGLAIKKWLLKHEGVTSE
jgi:methylated-DNA-[protein]-cysteine S-methyltransferase